MEAARARRSYSQFCPIARALDVLGERWTLLIVRELMLGPQRYTDLRDNLPGMWSNLLAQRLRDLETEGIVRRRELPPPAARTVYELTERGRALGPALHEIARWGLPYLDAPTPEQPLQPRLLPEGIRALVMLEHLPRRDLDVVLETDVGTFTVAVRDTGGPLLDRVQVSEGGVDAPDVVVRGSAIEAVAVRRGELTVEQTSMTFEGDRAEVAAARRLFGWA